MINYTIYTAKKVKKFLVRHPEIAKRFVEKIELMEYDPLDRRLDIVPLSGEDARFRLRIGKYRFLFEIIEDEILVYFYQADGRGDVYKK